MDITTVDFPWKRLWVFLLRRERHRCLETDLNVYQLVAGTRWREDLREAWGFYRMQDLLLKLEMWQQKTTRKMFVAWRAQLLVEEMEYKILAAAWRAWCSHP